MRITNVEIYPARKPSFLANAKVTLSDDEGNSVTITDFRLLRNKQSELWVAVPNYTIPDGKGWVYEPTIIMSRKLQFEVSEAVLGAFAKWQKEAR
jgi:DNA-binding cell septation regulator SpoVG